MLAMNERRARMTYDVPERVKRALNIRASRRDRSVGDLITEWVESTFTTELALADESIAEDSTTGTNKRGRPRKRSD